MIRRLASKEGLIPWAQIEESRSFASLKMTGRVAGCAQPGGAEIVILFAKPKGVQKYNFEARGQPAVRGKRPEE